MTRALSIFIVVSTIITCSHAQITSLESDDILNAPYRGTITTLRESCKMMPYGEVRNHIEPPNRNFFDEPFLSGSTIEIWCEGVWDRSVLRLYNAVDASGSEIDLTGTTELAPVIIDIAQGQDRYWLFSFKAIATKTLTPQIFNIKFNYLVNNNFPSITRTQTIVVGPPTGQYCAIPGISEAFHHGTTILDVSVGGARLTVPVGRTAEMIGAHFFDRDSDFGLSQGSLNEVLFASAAESTYLPAIRQFRINDPFPGTFEKTAWGTPLPGFLTGHYFSTDVFGPDGTHYDSFATTDGLNLVDRVRPLGVDDGQGQQNPHPASMGILYENPFPYDQLATTIKDHGGATPPGATVSSITLHRDMGVVDRITTSDGRGWDINTNVDGWIASIIPDSGKGARYFEYNNVGRVIKVKDAGQQVMYEYDYDLDSAGERTILAEEKRYVDGVLQTAVKHVIASPTLEHRLEYQATGEVRRYDFTYNGAELTSMTSYRDTTNDNVSQTPSGPAYTTIYRWDNDNVDGTVVLEEEELPDGTILKYDYDSNVDGKSGLNFGFLTKTTHWDASEISSLVKYDVDYEFFYRSGNDRMYWQPRIVHERDGRGAISQVVYEYEEGNSDENNDSLFGEESNQLFSRTGPLIDDNPDNIRTPKTTYEYYDDFVTAGFRSLRYEKTTYDDTTNTRDIEYQYDDLLRLKKEIRDPGDLNITTEYQYVDDLITQDRIVIDADNYYTETLFDPDGRVQYVRRYLTPGVKTGASYQTENEYDTNGYLHRTRLDNEDQNGVAIPSQPNPIVTEHIYDELGRVTLSVVDPTGIAQEVNFDYNWLGDVERQYDSSDRGTKSVFDGRGLVSETIPLAKGPGAVPVEVPALSTTFTYDELGRLRVTTKPTGAQDEIVYDDFGRVDMRKRIPGTDGGNTITTDFTYDNASNVIRTYVSENGVTARDLSDTRNKYDESGFLWESRVRLSLTTESNDDPVQRWKYDWAGNVIEERSLVDAFNTEDRVISTFYDDAYRVEKITDSEEGETIIDERDGRGNIKQQRVKLDGVAPDPITYAQTNFLYDAIGRVTKITDPEDHAGNRNYREHQYNSRDNLLRESTFTHDGTAVHTRVFEYDAAGRTSKEAVLANAAQAANTITSLTDRVVQYFYDADGRINTRILFKPAEPGQPTFLATNTTYDDLGRVEYVFDPSSGITLAIPITLPSAGYTKNTYAANGRLEKREIAEWSLGSIGLRTMTFGYDGHDRPISQTATGSVSIGDLTNDFEYDGLDREIEIENPKDIVFERQYDLAGRLKQITENKGGFPLERVTTFGYSRLGHRVSQAIENRTFFFGVSLGLQTTQYRYDTLGRLLRTVYPDSTDSADNSSCSDCIKMYYDLGGRMYTKVDQRGGIAGAIEATYDHRGYLKTRTSNNGTLADKDNFTFDAMGRPQSASGGDGMTITWEYTDLGDLDYEEQDRDDTVNSYKVDYAHDVAGNRTQILYPCGIAIDITTTKLNRIETMDVNGEFEVMYDYQSVVTEAPLRRENGAWPQRRRIKTDTTSSNVNYITEFVYDIHRRQRRVTNKLNNTTLSRYAYTHDETGNPLTQTSSGEFGRGDDRTYTVDDLDRLVSTEYSDGSVESTDYDLLGNRESHTTRTGQTTNYGAVTAANEYTSVGAGIPTYDAAGNLIGDENGRQYFYDRYHKLREVQDSSGTVLVRYGYDPLGRRMESVFLPNDPQDTYTLRYVYDGNRIIEERDDTDALLCYHVSGGLFVDERIATYDAVAGKFKYYLHNINHSVVATGNSDGSSIERLDYDSSGTFESIVYQGVLNHDSDADLDVDADDLASFLICFGSTDPACLAIHDFDENGNSDGIVDFADYGGFESCFSGADGPIQPGCAVFYQVVQDPPPTGTFAMHGRPIDVLDDGKVLSYVRARFYDPENGRWLQRDPAGYVDGGNLYEAFGSNGVANTDPTGEKIYIKGEALAGQLAWFASASVPGFAVHPFAVGNDTFTFSYQRYDPGRQSIPEILQWQPKPPSLIEESLGRSIVSMDFSERIWHLSPPTSASNPYFSARPDAFRQFQADTQFVLQQFTPPEAVGARISGTGRLGVAAAAGVIAVKGKLSLIGFPIGLGASYMSVDQAVTGLREIRSGQYNVSRGGQLAQGVLGDGLLGQAATTIYDVGPFLPALLPNASAKASMSFGRMSSIGARRMMVGARTPEHVMLRADVATALRLARLEGMNKSHLTKLRRLGANLAWAEEAQLLRLTGRGTRAWSVQEIDELLRTGRVVGYTPHHINSAAAHHWLASRSNNIEIVERWLEHAFRHGGDTTIPTYGPMINRQQSMILHLAD